MYRNKFVLLGLALVLVLAADAQADTFRIEIDYMVEYGANAHSHMPTAQEVAAVVQMFACQGHNLILEVGDEIPHHNVLQMDPDQAWNFFAYSDVPDSYGALKNEFYDHAGVSGWHYCIFGHQYEWIDPKGVYYVSGSSGLAETPGDDLVVTLGDFTDSGLPTGTPFEKASTLAHEFGHNLGLMHCGDMNCTNSAADDMVGVHVLNVASVMSYYYQLTGVYTNLVCQGLAPEFIPFKDIDYSHGTMCSLDENALFEELGTMMAAADWNCDSGIDTGSLQADLNGGSSAHWCGPGALTGVHSVLSDFDEWSALTDVTKSMTSDMLTHRPLSSCVTSTEMRKVADKLACVQPTLSIENCVTAEMHYVRADGRTGASGDCTDAHNSVGEAVTSAAGGSVIILEPMVWDAGGEVFRNRTVFITTKSTVLR
jgi:hypothetical protein